MAGQSSFQVACASIQGNEHLRRGKNNQDALSVLVADRFAVGVVCDGCGSGMYSELGARHGANVLSSSILKKLECSGVSDQTLADTQNLLESSRIELLKSIFQVASTMGDDLGKVILDHFLFTTVGFVITPITVSTFSIGDGLIAVNDDIVPLGPFPGNAPPYLSYALFNNSTQRESHFKFRIHHFIPRDRFSSLLIASDGICDIWKIAGSQDCLSVLEPFWKTERFFQNPDALRRSLFKANQEARKIDWENQKIVKNNPVFLDDTSLIVIRAQSPRGLPEAEGAI